MDSCSLFSVENSFNCLSIESRGFLRLECGIEGRRKSLVILSLFVREDNVQNRRAILFLYSESFINSLRYHVRGKYITVIQNI